MRFESLFSPQQNQAYTLFMLCFKVLSTFCSAIERLPDTVQSCPSVYIACSGWVLLFNVFTRLRPAPCYNFKFRFLSLGGKQHVIELGGGTGALSVGLARAGAASVACTDLPCHLARIQRTVHANTRPSSIGDCGGGGHSDEPTAPVAVQGLRWGDEGDLARVRAQRRNIGTARYIRGSGNRNVSCHTGETQSRSGGDGDGAATADLALDVCATSEAAAAAAEDDPYAFDVVVLSEVLYWPALDLLQEDTREPLRRTLLGLSNPGTKVILVYKER